MNERAPDAVLWNLFGAHSATRALGVVADLRKADALAAYRLFMAAGALQLNNALADAPEEELKRKTPTDA